MFKKTYQDNLRLLKKEQALTAAENAKKNTDEKHTELDPYESFVFDISDLDLEFIEANLLYKKNFAKIKHAYAFTMPAEAKFTRRLANPFVDIEAMLPKIIPDCQNVDDDFLTGYYLARFHLDLPKVMSSFSAGITKDSLTQGIYYSLAKTHPKTKWQMFGCDINPTDKHKAILKNGVKKPCNIYDQNSAASINIQLGETIECKTLDLYTCDVRSNSPADVLKQLLLVKDFLAPYARIVLRLPINWHTYYTSMSTILLFCVSYFKTVKIIKTPWGALPKYYLLLKDQKTNISRTVNTALKEYITALAEDADLPLISDVFYSKDEQEIIMQNIRQAYVNMMAFDAQYSSDEAIQTWTDLCS